ncbi:hypothetical protein E3D46_45220 [Burkholderia cepacia]|uniref:Uncharacterized protein n=1 Tax=Burkholderia cepacia TaxID=292 RepID=A0AAX2R9N6_BURCE|nr:hypothetical protein E3D36_39170 [Burkholderia cepacia]TEU31156.1 hypothetical protein E3D37_45455 [Burkholderia cepacia]TEU32361.1 hypothetical protein E3D38_45435 [Burkholderia cepacia]TEU82289.1 hypothetical protein E3D40_45540 [Burkholderia cepacia]TEU92542.1 hypothetical protein E3D44_45590 [Burkholderia cepacia]
MTTSTWAKPASLSAMFCASDWLRPPTVGLRSRTGRVRVGATRGRLRERAKSYAKALANDILR